MGTETKTETQTKTVTKKDLVDRIAEETGQRRTVVRDVLQHFIDEIVGELGSDNRLEFRDFGVFEVKRRAARTAQNPKTLERVPVPAKCTVKFKPGRKMREAMEQLDARGGTEQDKPSGDIEMKTGSTQPVS
ncbi:MAG: HU family DNA-binding protein [Planctomycetota bacterium]